MKDFPDSLKACSINDLIDKNIEYLSNLTQDEANLIENVLQWDPFQVMAFRAAKNMFEEENP